MTLLSSPVGIYFLIILSLQSIPCTNSVILFKQCTHEIDLANTPSAGHIFNACIQDHIFHREDHAWILTKSTIQRTTFNFCTFRSKNAQNITHSLSDTSWTDVKFTNSVFRGKQILFSKVFMRNVTFVNCSFAASVDLTFSSFNVKSIRFTDCNFAGRLHWTEGLAEYVRFEDCTFGGRTQRNAGQLRQRGDLNFSLVTLYDTFFNSCRGDVNTIHLSQTTVNQLSIRNSILGSVNCTSNAVDRFNNPILPIPVLVEQSELFNTTFTHSFSCPYTTVTTLVVRDVVVKQTFNLSGAVVIAPIIRGLSGTSRSFFDLNKAIIDHVVVGDRAEFRNISSMNLSWAHANIKSTIVSTGWDWKDEGINLTSTVFSKARVGKHCCSDLCGVSAGRGCLCNVTSEESTRHSCPPIDETVKFAGVDEADDENICFPADAVVHLSDNDTVRMDELQLGTYLSAKGANGKQWNFGMVYLFAHQGSRYTRHEYSSSSRQDMLYPFLSITVQAKTTNKSFTVVLSRDHLVPTQERGTVAAKYVRVDDVLTTVDGSGQVTLIQIIWKKGLYAPVTSSGRMIVNGVLVSCFTRFESIGHALLIPLRTLTLAMTETLGLNKLGAKLCLRTMKATSVFVQRFVDTYHI